MPNTNSINTNYGAAVALQTLNATNAALNTSQNRISTGLKVASSADDSAVYAIAQNLRSQNGALDAVTTSLNRGISTTGVASTAGSAISDLLTQVQSTVLAASDNSLDSASRAAYQQKYQSLTQQISTYVKNAAFNGVNLLDGSTSSYSALANSDGTSTISVSGQNLNAATSFTGGTYAAATLAGTNVTATNVASAATFSVAVDGGNAFNVTIPTGATTAAAIAAAINSASSAAGGSSTLVAVAANKLTFTSSTATQSSSIVLHGVSGDTSTDATLNTFLGTTVNTASAVGTAFTETGGGGAIQFSGKETFAANTNYADLISKIKASISNVSTALGTIGAASNAFTNHASFVSKLQDSLTTGIGNLVDADVAKESANLNALQTKQQLGVQALSIANSASSVLLSLFRG